MRRKTVYVTALLSALIFSHEAFAQNQLQVENIQAQIVGSPDSAGNVQFSVTATALNPTTYGTQFNVQLLGLDSNGAQVTNVVVSGRVGGRETGTLTGQGSLPQARYDSIVNWVQAR